MLCSSPPLAAVRQKHLLDCTPWLLPRADDWEDWESEEVELKLPAVGGAKPAAVPDVDETKFAGEDEGEDEPAWKASVPKTEQVSFLRRGSNLALLA